jgi:hypothetical protein
VERQQDLARTAPASSVAWQITRGYRLGAIPLDPTTLQPAGEAITDAVATIDYWAEHRDHAVGIRLGAQRGGTMALVGVQADTWAGWRAWVREHAVTSRVAPWSDEDLSRGELIRDLRPLGGPLAVKWQDRDGAVLRSTRTTRGDREMREAAEQLRLLNQGKDRGGWLVWSAGPDEKGRLPLVKGHPLGAGLDVLDSASVVPLWARGADGATLKQDGRVREVDANNDLPAWLADTFEVKEVRVFR